MSSSIIKLEDCQLGEISGGITAKQIAKKTGAYAIKGTCSVVTGVFGSNVVDAICAFGSGVGIGAHYMIKNGLPKLKNLGNIKDEVLKQYGSEINRCADIIGKSEYVTMPLFAVSGWKLGEYICQKIGLED